MAPARQPRVGQIRVLGEDTYTVFGSRKAMPQPGLPEDWEMAFEMEKVRDEKAAATLSAGILAAFGLMATAVVGLGRYL